MNDNLGVGLSPGSKHYRAYVGPPEDYDIVAAMCFGLMTSLGLRGNSTLLDVGCGSCRLGRLFIPYLNCGNYYGLEPNKWLVDEGIANEIGNDLIKIKNPTFCYSDKISHFEMNSFFDFAIAQSIFSHCGRDLLDQHLADISKSLKPSGALLATFLISETDTDQSGWIYPGCVNYRLDSMETIAQSHGLKFYLLDWLHPRQSWALFAKPDFDITWLNDRPLTWNTWLRYGQKQVEPVGYFLNGSLTNTLKHWGRSLLKR